MCIVPSLPPIFGRGRVIWSYHLTLPWVPLCHLSCSLEWSLSWVLFHAVYPPLVSSWDLPATTWLLSYYTGGKEPGRSETVGTGDICGSQEAATAQLLATSSKLQAQSCRLDFSCEKLGNFIFTWCHVFSFKYLPNYENNFDSYWAWQAKFVWGLVSVPYTCYKLVCSLWSSTLNLLTNNDVLWVWA